MNWRAASPDDILEDLRRVADTLTRDAYEPSYVVPQWYYDHLLKQMKRRAQRADRRARMRRKKMRGW